jgi:hypothetical protein
MIKQNIAINDNGFLFNPATGDSFSSNSVAAKIIQLMKDGQSLFEIKKQLLESYEVNKATMEKDLDDFIQLLKEYNLINS